MIIMIVEFVNWKNMRKTLVIKQLYMKRKNNLLPCLSRPFTFWS